MKFNNRYCSCVCVCVCEANTNTARITNFDEFSDFAQNVDSFRGSTVLIESDLDLSALYSPIEGFTGVFDGQGHVFSGLSLRYTNVNLALFNLINEGATIKNVVLDSSCVINSTTSEELAYVGGLVGTCIATDTKMCCSQLSVHSNCCS